MENVFIQQIFHTFSSSLKNEIVNNKTGRGNTRKHFLKNTKCLYKVKPTEKIIIRSYVRQLFTVLGARLPYDIMSQESAHL